MTPLNIIILAAGQGKRMMSAHPKVLHLLADKPLLRHVIESALTLKPNKTFVVYGHGGTQIQETFKQLPLYWIYQEQQLGTGHAVAQTLPYLAKNELALILYGDVPLINPITLQQLCSAVKDEQSLTILTATLTNPQGYGRIVRDANDQIMQIVEEKETDALTRAICEINTGILAVPTNKLHQWLSQLNNHNAQAEYYLTDIIEMAVADQCTIYNAQPQSYYEVLGVNDRSQLAMLERYYQRQQAEKLMKSGVTLRDPDRLDIRGQVFTGQDVSLDVNVILEGEVSLGNRVQVGANTLIRHAKIGDDVQILANCVIENVTIGNHCRIGPFARLRPDTVLAAHVHIGNFVEIKKSNVNTASKINHLSYIGDTEVGQDVNIGAGTITCNYDGVNKHKTIIEDRAFIGSDTQLVAPVTVEKGATIGAGSTIVRNAPAEQLTLSRSQQTTVPHWQRPESKAKEDTERKTDKEEGNDKK